MSCDELREQLPDFVLGTLSDVEIAAARRHLRGCAGCRAEAAKLDEGLVMFASAAHATDPPPELKPRVMAVLADEWAEAPAPKSRRPGFLLRWSAIAAVLAILGGALAWGGLATAHERDLRLDATSYRQFLQALGGKDVRVASLTGHGTVVVEGSAVMYDSDKGQSWVLVMARAPGYSGGPLMVTLSSRDGRSIKLHPLQIDAEGDGSTWLVTSADIHRFNGVQLISPGGEVLASG